MAQKISITQRTKVDRLINITRPLHSYSIPRPNEETFAYLLDLREPDVDQWPYMSMFAIIKAEVSLLLCNIFSYTDPFLTL